MATVVGASGFIAICTEQSIGKLFLAGIVPGHLIAFFFITIILWMGKNQPQGRPQVGTIKNVR
ncbi:MAG: hypothetical protein Q7J31_02840 [Syntrophales bacterium]|nr:hypothetical protein [Syntrophales bacterium]